MRTTFGKMTFGAAAAVFAATLLLPVLVAAQETKASPPAANERPGRMLAREALDLTPGQEKALGEFRKARAEEARAFREEVARLRTEMRELAKDPEANRAKLDALIDKSARLRAERAKAAFRNRTERDKIFTPEQREKMKAFRERLARRPGVAGRGQMGFGRMGVRGQGRFMGPGFGAGRLARLRALRHRPLLRRWR